MTAMMKATGIATVTATVTAIATVTPMTMICQSYRAWQVPALGSKGEAIRLFLFKPIDHVKTDGDDDDESNSSSSSKSDSNRTTDDDDNDVSVI